MSWVRRMLDLSTAHLPEVYGKALDREESIIAYETDHGWLMWVPCDPEDSSAADEVPAEILTVQLYARALDCDWVLFDCDGTVDDGLPRWEW
jgi:hypothetical protein